MYASLYICICTCEEDREIEKQTENVFVLISVLGGMLKKNKRISKKRKTK